MRLKIVRLDVVDYDWETENPLGCILGTYYLINPDESKLRELMVKSNHRYEDEYEEDNFCIALNENGIGVIEAYIEENFQTISIERKEIQW